MNPLQAPVEADRIDFTYHHQSKPLNLKEKSLESAQSYLPPNYLSHKKLHPVKFWHDIQSCESIHLFYSLEVYEFWAIIVTKNGIELVPGTKNGFDSIKVPSPWRNRIRSSPNDQYILKHWIPILNKEIRYSLIKKTMDEEYIIELRIGGLMGGGAKVSKTSPSRSSNQSLDSSPGLRSPNALVLTHESSLLRSGTLSPVKFGRQQTAFFRQDSGVGDKSHDVRKFLLHRYNLRNSDRSSKDLMFVEELADKICEVLLPSQNFVIYQHLNEMIDTYETEFFDHTVLKVIDTKKVKPSLEDYVTGFTSKELCLSLLREGYYAKEQARGGIGQMISEKILKNLSTRMDKFEKEFKELDKAKEEDSNPNDKKFDKILLKLVKKEDLEEMLANLSKIESDKARSLIKDKLNLKSNMTSEVVGGFVNSDLTIQKIKDELFSNDSQIAKQQKESKKNQDSLTFGNQMQLYLSKLRLEVLSDMNLLDHEPSTLVELYNILLQKGSGAKNTTYGMNSKKMMLEDIRNLIMNILQSYKENESTMKKEELEYLLPLAFTQDVEVFRLFLEYFLFDFSNDILFDPKKVNMLSFILIGAMKNKNFKDFCTTDDLITCLKILKPKIEDLSITTENVNLQEAMTSLNNILFLMGFIGAKGVRNDDLEKIQELTKYLETHTLEKAVNLVKRKSKNPSLDMKRQYAIEALKRIEVTSFEEWQNIAQKITQVSQVIVDLGTGIFAGELANIGSALLQIKDLVFEFYVDRPKSWYNDANVLRFLIDEPIAIILEELFEKKESSSNVKYTFFAAELLLSVASQPHRKPKEKKIAAQALWFLAHGYHYIHCRNSTSLIKSKRFMKNLDIIHYVLESLTGIAETANLDFSLFVRKIINSTPPKLEFEELLQSEFTAKSKSQENSANEETLGKKFYLRVLMEKTPKLYTLARIQQHSEKTLSKPEVLVDLQVMKKDKENTELFKELLRVVSDIDDPTVLSNARGKLEKLLEKEEATKEEFNDALEEIAKNAKASDQKVQTQENLVYLKDLALKSLNEKIAAVTTNNTKDVSEVVEDFIEKSSEKVLLLQGDAGSGKTLLLHLEEEKLWKKYNVLFNGNAEHKSRLPLRIILSEVRSYDKAVEGFLLQNGCTMEAMEEIKKEPVVIMFDGYDEINQNINLYNLNKLHEWEDVKVIFTSRKDNLSSLKEDYVLCFSPGKDKNQVLSYLILPINEMQIEKYFNAQKQKNLTKIKVYEKELTKILEFDKKSPLPLTWICEKLIKEFEQFLKSEKYGLLTDLREKLKTMLPEIIEIEKEIKTIKMDNVDYTPITQAFNNLLEAFQNLPEPSDQDTIISNLFDCLDRISEIEESKNLSDHLSDGLKSLENVELSKRIESIIKKIEKSIDLAESFRKKLQTWIKDYETEPLTVIENDKKRICVIIDAYFWNEMKEGITAFEDCTQKLTNFSTQEFTADNECVKVVVTSQSYKDFISIINEIFAENVVLESKSISKKAKIHLKIQAEESKDPDQEAARDEKFSKINLCIDAVLGEADKNQSNETMRQMASEFVGAIRKYSSTKKIFDTLFKEVVEYIYSHIFEKGKIERFKEDIQNITNYNDKIKTYSVDFKEKFVVVQAFKDQIAKLNSYSTHKDYISITHKLEERMHDIVLMERAAKSSEIRTLSKVKAIEKRIIELKKFTDLESIISRFKDIATCPFMLKMLLETLAKFPESSANKAKLYNLFVNIHFERERDKLIRTEKVPTKFNIIDSFYHFSKDLAINMFMRKVTSIHAKSKGYKMLGAADTLKPNAWNRFFDDTDPVTRLARKGAQIIEDEGFVRFAHKSLMEYFAARTVADEIIDFDSGDYQDYDFCLERTSVIDNETAIYEFVRDIADDDNEKDQKETSVFDKKLMDMLNIFITNKKYQDDLEKGVFLSNMFLILLLRKNVAYKISQLKDDSPVLGLIMNIMKWIFSDSQVSKKFVDILEKARNCENSLYEHLKPLLLTYYHIMTKRANKTEIGTRLNSHNLKFKISLPPKEKKEREEDEEEEEKAEEKPKEDGEKEGKEEQSPSQSEIFEPEYTMKGKLSIHGSLDNIVLIQTSNNGKHLMAKDSGEDPNKEDDPSSIGSKLALNDVEGPGEIREYKWVMRMTSLISFNLYSVQNPNIRLTGTFIDKEAYKTIFGGGCTRDAHTDKYLREAPFFTCQDCNTDEGTIYCSVCADHCHKGHKLVPTAFEGGFCDCRFVGTCQISKECTARFGSSYASAVMYKCSQCHSDASDKVLCLPCKQHHEKECSHTTFEVVKDGKGCQCGCVSSRSHIMAHSWPQKHYSD